MPMFGLGKKIADKLFVKNRETGKTIPIPDEIPELETTDEEKDSPMPMLQGGEITFEAKTEVDKETMKMITCYGVLPYRKDGCQKCKKVNDCIKKKVSDDWNRRAFPWRK